MSDKETEDKPQPVAQAPEQPAAEPAKPDALTIMATQLEEMRAEFKRTTELLAKAIVDINTKVDAKAAGGGGGDPLSAVLAQVLKQPTAMPIEDFAKQAEAIAKAADAIDRFRIKPPLGVGEALLMRIGMRAAFPRYMTKAELARYERTLGAIGAFGEEEGGHVTE